MRKVGNFGMQKDENVPAVKQRSQCVFISPRTGWFGPEMNANQEGVAPCSFP